MKRPHFRVRTLLILVMVAGVASSSYVLWRRSQEFSRRAGDAEMHAKALDELARSNEESADSFKTSYEDVERARREIQRESVKTRLLLGFVHALGKAREVEMPDSPVRLLDNQMQRIKGMETKDRKAASKYKRLRDEQIMVKLKYRRAAGYPWLLVAPDPPEPE